ncbi:hypothetical protein [Geodermatophilus sp. SYSU D00079]
MTRYGFRLFDATIRRSTEGSNGRKYHPMESCGTEDNAVHYRQVVAQVLNGMGKRLLIGEPKLNAPDDATEVDEDAPILDRLRGKAAFRLEWSAVSGNIVYGLIRKGVYGSHDLALGPDPDAEDLPLEGFAPSSGYRFILNLPSTGMVGTLAVEDIGRSCPADLLARWLRHESQALARAEMTKRKAENPGAVVEERPWWNPLFRQMTDPDHLDEILKSGQFGEIRLEKRGFDTARSPKGNLLYRVTAPHIAESKVDELRQVVGGWLKRDVADDKKVTDAAGAKQLAALIDDTDLAEIDFSDGYIKPDEAGTRAISPSRLTDLFVYPQTNGPSNRRTSGIDFYRAVKTVAQRLGGREDASAVGLQWPTDLDVGEGR